MKSDAAVSSLMPADDSFAQLRQFATHAAPRFLLNKDLYLWKARAKGMKRVRPRISPLPRANWGQVPRESALEIVRSAYVGGPSRMGVGKEAYSFARRHGTDVSPIIPSWGRI